MLTYYSKGQKAEFVMTEQSAVRVESSGVSGNIFIKPPVGKERIISLNFAPFYTQLDDFDAGTVVFLSVDSGFGRVGLEVTGNNTIQVVNNQSLLSFKKGSRLTPPVVPQGEDGVLFIDQNGILCTVDKFGVVLEIGGVRLVAVPLAGLSNIVIFEKSYEMMTPAERTATAGGGGYFCFAVSGNAGSPNYAIYSSATENGDYLIDVDNVPYTPSALINNSIGFDHRTLAISDEYNFPASFAPNSLGIIGDTAGQKELCLLNDVGLSLIGGETIRALSNVGVATHYSVPIRVGQDENARIYPLTTYGQDPTIRANGTRYYKIAPKDPSGAIKLLNEIAAIPVTITSKRNAPNPPRAIRCGFIPFQRGIETLTFFPDTAQGNEMGFAFLPSSKEADVTPSSFFNASGVAESGVTYKVDVEGLNGLATPVRTLTLDIPSKSVKYFGALRSADGARISTKYTIYAEKAGVKSDGLVQTITQGTVDNNPVNSIGLTQVTGTVKALFTLAGGAGVERNVYFVELSGTLKANINLSGITIAGVGAALLESTADGFSFYVQSGKAAANFELTIPFTGGVGNTLTVKSGNDGDNRTASITIV